MSEDVKPVDQAPATEPVIETPQVDPTEVDAREQGWVSKEEWVASGRPADEHRSAKEFVERGELYKSIHSTKRELKQTQAVLNALQGHHKMVYEKAYQQAYNDLKMQKRMAIREGDLEALEVVEDKMEQLQRDRVREVQAFNQAQAAAQSTGIPDEFQSFVDKNPWYMTDKAMRNEADAAGFIFLNNGGDRSQLFQHVEKEMKRKFPEKLGVKRAAPNAVAPTSRQGQSGKQADVELNETERDIMKQFVRMGVMTEAQYKQELKKAKERG